MSQDLERPEEGQPLQTPACAAPAAKAEEPPAGCGLSPECRHQRSIKWATWCMVVLMLVGAGIGYRTYYIYRKQLEVQIFKGLTDQDQAILVRARQHSHTEAFYAELPRTMDALERTERRMQLIVSNDYQARPWKDIPDLGCLLFEEDGFHSQTKVRLREAYGVAEDLLYLLSNASSAHDSELLPDEEYHTWMAYLPEVGDHPLFLAAIYFWHNANYLGPELAAELRDKLCRPDTPTRATIKALFPEMLEPDWPARVGQKKANCSSSPEGSARQTPSLLRLRERPPGPAAPAGGAARELGAGGGE